MRTAPIRHDPHAINHLPCVFRGPLGNGGAVCEFARRECPPDGAPGAHQRRPMRCTQPLARAACAQFDGLLREKSVFVLRRRDPAAPLAASTAQSLQAGGLNGLRDLIDAQAAAPNIAALLSAALARYGTLSAIPWEPILRAIGARRRR